MKYGTVLIPVDVGQLPQREVDMYTLLREYRYRVLVGPETHVLRIEELIQGTAGWGGRFRVQLPASHYSEATTIYGASEQEVAESAARLIDRTY